VPELDHSFDLKLLRILASGVPHHGFANAQHEFNLSTSA
jgi:hypothetical protein